jgi:hypothetical protein
MINESGLLDKLKPGDAIFADKGFLDSDELRKRGIQLITPTHLKGRILNARDESVPLSKTVKCGFKRKKEIKQLAHKHVHRGAMIARHRIHVERHNFRIKSFRILNKIPLSLKDSVNKIFNVCAYLTLFTPPMVEHTALPKKLKQIVTDQAIIADEIVDNYNGVNSRPSDEDSDPEEPFPEPEVECVYIDDGGEMWIDGL